MKTKTIIKFGMAALAMGVFFGVNLPVKVKADQVVWVRAPKLNYFEARGLVPPGSYSHDDKQKAAAIAVNKAGQGVGEQKQTTQSRNG
jgi:hypothetical protein